MKVVDIQYYKSSVGELIVGIFDNQVCLCDWRYRNMRASIDKRIQQVLDATYREVKHPLHQEVLHQFQEYFEKKREIFDVPLLLVGTVFQKKVWEQLLKIPYGQAVTYLQLSQQLGNELAIRAVASANGANAISIIVPCHRVVGQNAAMTGYAGGIAAKKKLLELEGATLLKEPENQITLF